MEQESLQYSILPSKPGVYLFKNSKNNVVYVGKAKDLRKRVASYFSQNGRLDAKTQNLLGEIHHVDHILVSSEIEAFLLEANLIKKYQPFYNSQFKDDKSYPYIKIGNFKSLSTSSVPYITISRKKDDKNALYFGRYPDATSVKIVLKLLRRIFPYQSVKNHPKRRCLYYHLNLCPCVTFYPEKLKEYKYSIYKIKKFLEGRKDNIIVELEKERNRNTKKEEFEKASEIQDKIDRINIITSPTYDPFRYEKDPDLYNNRIKKELESLKDILSKYFKNSNIFHGLKSMAFVPKERCSTASIHPRNELHGILEAFSNELKRIECYDISNIQGTNATASMVVFINGDVSKADYRRFRIRSKQTPDDYLMMKEVLRRRFKHDGWELPQLIVIDGGKGQVRAAMEVVHHYNLHIPLIGLAKREETIVIPVFQNQELMFFQEKLPLSTPGLNLLRRIRDEAHRFAITYHKLLRKKSLTSI